MGSAQADTPVDFDRVYSVIQQRCSMCHSATPSSAAFASAPAGVILDTPRQIRSLALRIQAQAVDTQLMPLGNITGMTAEERELVGQWVDQQGHP